MRESDSHIHFATLILDCEVYTVTKTYRKILFNKIVLHENDIFLLLLLNAKLGKEPPIYIFAVVQ